MKYNKLIRDKLAPILMQTGNSVTMRTLKNDDEYKAELEKKLDEEVAEFHGSKSVEELIDVLDVLDALAKAYGFRKINIARTRIKKRIDRGGFAKRIFLEQIEDEGRGGVE